MQPVIWLGRQDLHTGNNREGKARPSESIAQFTFMSYVLDTYSRLYNQSEVDVVLVPVLQMRKRKDRGEVPGQGHMGHSSRAEWAARPGPPKHSPTLYPCSLAEDLGRWLTPPGEAHGSPHRAQPLERARVQLLSDVQMLHLQAKETTQLPTGISPKLVSGPALLRLCVYQPSVAGGRDFGQEVLGNMRC